MHPSIFTHLLNRRNKKSSPTKTLEDFINGADAYETITTGKIMAKAWSNSLDEEDQLAQGQTFIYTLINAYWGKNNHSQPLPKLFKEIDLTKIDSAVLSVATAMGIAASRLPIDEASYLLGNVYTAVLPESTRSNNGVFYTPPSLTTRLIQIAEKAGVNWATASVLDPACGGGAFLAPVCLKKVAALKDATPQAIIQHINTHVTGWEIDPFGGWLTQVFAETALKDTLKAAGMPLKRLVRICNSLELDVSERSHQYDLVIGNPPYGKVKLTDAIRDKFKDSLYGHPNLYGLFTHLTLQLSSKNGVIALLTPTSFLSGEYFKKLRQLLRTHAHPVEIDFVSFRKGVFEDVLQETMLAVYKNSPGKQADSVKVNQITTKETGLAINKVGAFPLSTALSAPWVLPRTPEQAAPVQAMKEMVFVLRDWGYKISTGPLVWNRHKSQLREKTNKDTYPIIWSEAITTDGQFILRAEKKNHTPYFEMLPGDEWLVTTQPCILLQRTTAKEQNKRLIAAALPGQLLAQYKGVVIENHLNMILPIVEKPAVPAEVLAAFLNSKAVNEAFRAISGSVAVSAYELESLPLPAPEKLVDLITLVNINSELAIIETACQKIYLNYK
jgi:adenine-specific DNA-methyltransferase